MDILTSGGFIRQGPLVGSGLTLPATSLAGNSTGSAGAVQAITMGAGLSLSGSVLSATVAGFDGSVTTYASLPVDGSAALNAIYLVRQGSGTWLINRKQPGLYQRVATTGVLATDWQYLGEWLEEFSSSNFSIYDGSDNTKLLTFNLASIATGTTRTITFPNQSGTIVLQGAATGSGLTLATSRLLGRTTASTGAIEEISVGTSLSFSAGTLDAIQSIRTTDTPTFVGVNGTTTLLLKTGGTTAATINSSQQIGLGLTPSGSYQLEVGGQIAATATGTTQRFFSTKNSAGENQFGVFTNGVSYVGTVGATDLTLYSNSNERVRVSSAGAIKFNTYGAGTLTTDASGNITASSDETLKDVLGFYVKGMAALRGIRPITYRWNAKSRMERVNTYSGFSAQNVRDHLPEAVGTNFDGTLTVQDRTLMAAVINAVKEIDQRVAKLEHT